MIIKPLKPTHELLQIEALNRRLPHNHTMKDIVSTKARNLRAGYNGERALQFPLSFLPKEKYLILHQLLFKDSNGYFQIDTLLLSTNFLLIIEAKNIRDHVIFDELGQTYRKEVDREQGFSNPVQQVQLQHRRLLQLLRKFDLPAIPIEKIVVYTNPNTVLKNLTKKNVLPKVVIQKESLLEKVDEFVEMHPEASLSGEELADLAYLLLVEHEEKKIKILDKYEIKIQELIKGVMCSACEIPSMERYDGRWRCLKCKIISHTAHREALKDYALLINDYITNNILRDFLRVNSSNIAKQILQKEKFTHYGKNKGRRYRIDIEELLVKS